MNPSPLPAGSRLLRLGVIAGVVGALAGGFAWTAGWIGPQRLSAQAFIDRFEQNAGHHPGYRRAHAKGLCVSGWFESSGAAAALSSAEVFQPGRLPVLGRLSIGSGSPHTPDIASPVRSLALLIEQRNGEQWRTAMNTPPVLAVGTPQAFFEQVGAMRPDPATGKPDPAAMQAFFAAHPESAAFLRWAAGNQPSSSFASTRYHGIHAFNLVAADGSLQPVRWALQPESEAQPLQPDGDPNQLQREFAARLTQGPVRWKLLLTLAEPGDVVDDSSQAWPAERRELEAGVLVIEQAEAQLGGACQDINFDPLVLPKGIQASADPILRARSVAYAESFRRRSREGAPQTLVQPEQGARP